jgi:hypothetical protein
MGIKKMTAASSVAVMFAAPMLMAAPAEAAERDFRYGGAKIEYQVGKDDGRFEVEVEIDAKRASKWRVTLRHDGKRYHNRVHRADRDDDVEIEKDRRDTKGKDVFKVRVKKVGGPAAVTRTIRKR